MKILLVGEYSRLHNSLKEGLVELGHEVTLIGNGDLFKKYPADIHIDADFFKKPIFSFLRKGFFKLFGFDFADYEVSYRLKKKLPELKGYDIIQLINEDALCIAPFIQIPLLKKLINQNKSAFLLCCGDDHISIQHYLKNDQKYSILTPYLDHGVSKKHFRYALKYLTKPYKKLHEFLYEHIKGVISTDLDYYITQVDRKSHLGMIPNPVNTNLIKSTPKQSNEKLTIFHGVNELSKIRKGASFFEKALDKIQKLYGDKVNIQITYSLPYKEYIKVYEKAHILLDQVYAFDQGYNALEGMAAGKVVFTGADDIWLNQYNLKEDTIAINALPDEEAIFKKLEWLILNPEKVSEIGANARKFIEKEHDYIKVAQQYTQVWNNAI
ncbi:MAG: glycosyltransferase family protein [bacterium]